MAFNRIIHQKPEKNSFFPVNIFHVNTIVVIFLTIHIHMLILLLLFVHYYQTVHLLLQVVNYHGDINFHYFQFHLFEKSKKSKTLAFHTVHRVRAHNPQFWPARM